MQEFLLGFVTWPQVMWVLGSAVVALFVLVAWLDKKDWSGWAAFMHFLCAGVAGLSWFWGETADGLIYQIFSLHAFWVNLIAMSAYLAATWWQDRKYDCLIAIDDD